MQALIGPSSDKFSTPSSSTSSQSSSPASTLHGASHLRKVQYCVYCTSIDVKLSGFLMMLSMMMMMMMMEVMILMMIMMMIIIMMMMMQL